MSPLAAGRDTHHRGRAPLRAGAGGEPRETDHRSPAAPAPAVPHRAGAADLALLPLRLTVGLLLAGHGAQKLFGLFGGQGLEATGNASAALGYRPGVFFAGLAGGSALPGGLGPALGLFTPPAAAALIGVMINAMVLTSGQGLWEAGGGMEYPLTVAVVALTVATVGPGRLSCDRAFPWRDGGLRPAAFSLGAGGAGAAIVPALQGRTIAELRGLEGL